MKLLLFMSLQLLTGSREVIDLNFGPSESPKLARQVSLEQEALAAQADYTGSRVGVFDTEPGEDGITYELMQSIIEHVLQDSGYYDMLPVADGCRKRTTMPLSRRTNTMDHFGPQNAKS